MKKKDTDIQIGICEDVTVVVASILIQTAFLVLDMPEDDSLYIILGRPFLNTTGVVIDCTKGEVTLNVDGNQHIVYVPMKNMNQNKYCPPSTRVMTITIGMFDCPMPHPKMKFQTIIIAIISVKVEEI